MKPAIDFIKSNFGNMSKAAKAIGLHHGSVRMHVLRNMSYQMNKTKTKLKVYQKLKLYREYTFAIRNENWKHL